MERDPRADGRSGGAALGALARHRGRRRLQGKEDRGPARRAPELPETLQETGALVRCLGKGARHPGRRGAPPRRGRLHRYRQGRAPQDREPGQGDGRRHRGADRGILRGRRHSPHRRRLRKNLKDAHGRSLLPDLRYFFIFCFFFLTSPIISYYNVDTKLKLFKKTTRRRLVSACGSCVQSRYSGKSGEAPL